MKVNFKESLRQVLVWEGGYSNHPKDPGGATMQGVIQRVYDAYRKSKKQPLRPVKQMVAAERDAIYRKQYWDAIKGDQLPEGIDYVVFDGAVNSGPKQSIKWLQRALGVNADGVMGTVTLQALEAHNSPSMLIDKICDRRLAFLKALNTWSTFGKGWNNRVSSVRRVGKSMVAKEELPVALIPTDITGKAYIESAKTLPSKAPADVAIGTGLGGGALTQITDQLTPLSSLATVGYIITALTVAGGLIALGGFAYRWYATRKEKKLIDALDLEGQS